jgi:hypothetical protein
LRVNEKTKGDGGGDTLDLCTPISLTVSQENALFSLAPGARPEYPLLQLASCRGHPWQRNVQLAAQSLTYYCAIVYAV